MRFIAECGLNHNGNLDLLFEMISGQSGQGPLMLNFNLVGELTKMK